MHKFHRLSGTLKQAASGFDFSYNKDSVPSHPLMPPGGNSRQGCSRCEDWEEGETLKEHVVTCVYARVCSLRKSKRKR
eukprot:scaffold60435_cov26-Tisochrysis_lutea.AAC.1